jgi:hypothetical protein
MVPGEWRTVNTAAKLGTTEVAPDAVFAVRHYSPAEIAELWNLSTDTVIRMFEREDGVLIF